MKHIRNILIEDVGLKECGADCFIVNYSDHIFCVKCKHIDECREVEKELSEEHGIKRRH